MHRAPGTTYGSTWSWTLIPFLAGGNTPTRLDGYGPIAADLAREMTSTADRASIRRLFTSPDETDLVRMETTARTYTGLLRELIEIRDDTCRTPYCDAPIRHIDHINHIKPCAAGGPTSYGSAQGLCETRNYTEEHPDHTARSTRPPPLPGGRRSRLEDKFRTLIDINLVSSDTACGVELTG